MKPELIEELRSTVWYRDGVEKLAQKFNNVTTETLEQLINFFIDNSEYVVWQKIKLLY